MGPILPLCRTLACWNTPFLRPYQMFRWLLLALRYVAFLILVALCQMADAKPPAPTKVDMQWTMPAKNYASTRFSEETQINVANVKQLGDFHKIIYPSGGPNQDVPFGQDWVTFQSGFNRQHRLLR